MGAGVAPWTGPWTAALRRKAMGQHCSQQCCENNRLQELRAQGDDIVFESQAPIDNVQPIGVSHASYDQRYGQPVSALGPSTRASASGCSSPPRPGAAPQEHERDGGPATPVEAKLCADSLHSHNDIPEKMEFFHQGDVDDVALLSTASPTVVTSSPSVFSVLVNDPCPDVNGVDIGTPVRQPNEVDQTEVQKVLEAAQERLPNCRLTNWQSRWCTHDNVSIYAKARPGDHAKAGEILAQTLLWREQQREVLSGERLPRWQGDMRVLVRSEAGHPVIYFSFRHTPRSQNAKDTVEHMACVLEAAVNSMTNGATTFDFVCDCVGFRMANSIDPRPTCALMEMLKNPYRARLRQGLIVDAPRAFSAIWRVGSGIISEATRRKIFFQSMDQAKEHLLLTAGAGAAEVITRVMQENRSRSGGSPYKQPAEFDY